MFLRGLNILGVLLAVWSVSPSLLAETASEPVASKKALYTPDPNHLWNRLHRTLFVRTAADGTEYGFDTVDPLLWHSTKFLLEGTSHENAVKVLDEFLSSHGENLITDPVKRAMLQRDLWAVFDWMSQSPYPHSPKTEARRALQKRLAMAVQRLALTREQIDALPDNYADAVKSHQFGKDYDSATPSAAFLPADLFSTNGSWVCVGLYGQQRIAPVHVSHTGRSAFLVFMRTPGSRQETTNYLKSFREVAQPYIYKRSQFVTNEFSAEITPDLPEFPNGTEFALVRQAILLDAGGELRPTHFTESVQIRHYNDVISSLFTTNSSHAQVFFEFEVSRERLFAGIAGGLHPTASNEKKFRQFFDKGFDPFEYTAQRHESLSNWFRPALDCATCHSGHGVYSVNSFLQRFTVPTPTLPEVREVPAQEQRDAAWIWKQQQFSFGLLQGFWERN